MVAMITCAFENGNKASLRHASVDTIVLRGDELLLVKRTAKLLEGGKWGLAGGYVDRDETLAQAAEREVFEETGWKVKGLTLLTIRDNPDRPKEDRQNISFVYFCQAARQTGKPDWESDEIRWFPITDVPPQQEMAFDHAGNIDLYKKYLRENLDLPILN